MTLKEEYENHVSGGSTVSWSKRALFRIVSDITGRSGLGNEWEQIDEEIQEEIMAEWLEIIEHESV
jgi:hypothetical protein